MDSTITGQVKSLSHLMAALKACSKKRDLERGKRLHEQAIEFNLHTNKYVAAGLIKLYSNCRRMRLAQNVFDGMVERDVVAWTSLILGYAENGQNGAAMKFFTDMDCEPNTFTYVAGIKACGGLAAELKSEEQTCLATGIAIHEQVKNRGYESHVIVANTLVDMYCKCGGMHRAKEVFDGMCHRNVITWTSLMLGYVENGQSYQALELFQRMDCEPDSCAYVAALKACGSWATEQEKRFCLETGISIHKHLRDCKLDTQILVATTLLDMYCKCGSMLLAREVFDAIIHKDVVAWNSLLLGYAENDASFIALNLFHTMNCTPNSFTFVAVLKACGNLVALSAGQETHATICKLGLEQEHIVATALMVFYGKCSSLIRAEDLFNSMGSPDSVAWNTLIAGYGAAGESSQVFKLCRKMQESGVAMNGITFTCILTACSHAGLVDEARLYFDSMPTRYGIAPSVEHYSCMIDMLGRANRLNDALALVRSMPVKANSVVWMSLLGACRRWKNSEVGKLAFDALVGAGTRKAAAYVLISDATQSY